MLTQSRLKTLLQFDPETGNFYWIKANAPQGWAHISGRPAGSNFDGYRRIKIDQKNYLVHRLVWLWTYGEFPKQRIDHKDLDGMNNKPSNLRLATGSQNVINVGLKSNNTTGIKGVYWNKTSNKWQAALNVNGKQIHLGYFTDKDKAEEVVRKKREEVHGEFARHA